MPYTEDELIEMLQELAGTVDGRPTVSDLQAHEDSPSYPTYTRRFGSWDGALEAAGLRPSTLDADALVEMLHELAAETGETPTVEMVNDAAETPHVWTFQDRFGSFSAALEAAGFEPNTGTKRSDADLLDELARLTRELGRAPSELDMDEAGAYGATTYRERWGDWNRALEEVAIDPPTRPRDSPTDRELITELRDLANYRKSGVTARPSKRQMNADGPHSYRIYRERFGSWAAALVQAGLDPRQHITAEDVLEEIHAVAAAVGIPDGGQAPTVDDWTNHAELSLHTVLRHFERWNAAVAAAGYTPNPGREAYAKTYTDMELVEAVRRVADELRAVPTVAAFEAESDIPSTTIERRLGSFNRALQLAGLRPRRQSPGGVPRGSSTAVEVDRSPGSADDPRIDAIAVDVGAVVQPIAVGDILLDHSSPVGGYHIIDISAAAVALEPSWEVETTPADIETPHTRTFYGDELRSQLGDSLNVLSKK
jgi:hypothetical protein